MKLRARLPLWCAVPAGVLAAHAVGYAIAYRDPRYRADVLAATGHGYLGHALIVAVLASAAAVSIAVARGIREQRTARWWDAAARISVVQTAAFFGVEVLERIAAGVAPLSGMTHVIAVGFIVQILMGALVASVLLVLERAGRTIAAVVRSELRARPSRREATVAVFPQASPTRVTLLADSARSPPLLLAST